MLENYRYKGLFQRNPALLVALDRDGYFVDASDAWLTRFGFERDEIAGMRPQDLATETSVSRILDTYLPLLRRAGHLAGVPFDMRRKSVTR